MAPIPLRWKIWLAAALLALLAAARPRAGSNDGSLQIVYRGDDSHLQAYVERLSSLVLRSDPYLNVFWFSPSRQQQQISAMLQRSGASQHSIVSSDESIKPFSTNNSTIFIDAHDNALSAVYLRSPSLQQVQIMSAVVSNRPRQMMVTIVGNSVVRDGVIEVESIAARGRSPFSIDRDQSLNLFVDLTEISPEMLIRVTDSAGAPIGQSRVWRLEFSAAKVVAADDTEASFKRFANAYAQIHPPGAASPEVMLSSQLPDDRLGVRVAKALEEIDHPSIVQKDHAIFAHTDLRPLHVLSLNIAAPPSNDWQVIASASNRPILAVREAPARQVWLGFSSDGFQQREAFVIMLADIVDWIAGGSDVHGHLDHNSAEIRIASDEEILRAIAVATKTQHRLASPLCMVAAGLALLSLLIRR